MVRSGRQWGNLPGEVRGSPITEMFRDGPRSHGTGALLESPPSSASDGAIPMGMRVIPRWWRFGGNVRFLASFPAVSHPGARCRAGRGAAARAARSSRDLPQLFPFPKENRGCLERWDHPRGEGRKEPFSRALPPGKRESGRRGTSRGSVQIPAPGASLRLSG